MEVAYRLHVRKLADRSLRCHVFQVQEEQTTALRGLRWGQEEFMPGLEQYVRQLALQDPAMLVSLRGQGSRRIQFRREGCRPFSGKQRRHDLLP
jgi:hypothetical protein